MSRGKIKKIIEDKGYGFIRAEDGSEIFFHRSDLQDVDINDLKEGDHMEFDVKKDPRGRGPKAVHVRKVLG